jgi:hypothetical protein
LGAFRKAEDAVLVFRGLVRCTRDRYPSLVVFLLALVEVDNDLMPGKAG